MSKTHWFEKDGQILCKWYGDEHSINIAIREGEPLSLSTVAMWMNRAYAIGQAEKQQQVRKVLGIE